VAHRWRIDPDTIYEHKITHEAFNLLYQMDYQHYQRYQQSAINSYYHFRLTSPFPPLSPLFLKIKFLQAYFFRHANHGIRALQNLKPTINAALYKGTRAVIRYTIKLIRGANNKRMKKKKKAVNSITVHVNYSSLHILPVVDQAYYDADWNSVIHTEEITPLSGYLEWLEDNSDETANVDEEEEEEEDDGCNDGSDINRRAESFIARCYERFKLEKQESYRRYQEMMARSL
jgi:Cotton fibre expressed protein